MSDSTNDGSYLRRLVQRTQRPLKRPDEHSLDEAGAFDHAEIQTITDGDLDPVKVPKMVDNDNDPARILRDLKSVSTPKSIQEPTPETSLLETPAQQVSRHNTLGRNLKPGKKVTADNQVRQQNDVQESISQNSDPKAYSNRPFNPSVELGIQATPDTKNTAEIQSKNHAQLSAQRQVQKPEKHSRKSGTPLAASKTPSSETQGFVNQAAKNANLESVNVEPQLQEIKSLREKTKKIFENKNQVRQKPAAWKTAQLKTVAHTSYSSKPDQDAPSQETSVQKHIQKNIIRQVSNNHQTIGNSNSPNKTAGAGSLHIGQVNIVVKSSKPDIPTPKLKSQSRSKAPITTPALKSDNRRYRKRF